MSFQDEEIDRFDALKMASEQRRTGRAIDLDIEMRREFAEKANVKRSLETLLADPMFQVERLRNARATIISYAPNLGQDFDLVQGYRMREVHWLLEQLLVERAGR